MIPLREDPGRAVIIGAGQGGAAMIEMLQDEDLVDVVAVVDMNPDAAGILLAREHGIPVFDDVAEALEKSAPCVAFNMTGNEMVDVVASDILGAGGVIGGMEARLIWRMVTNLKRAKRELHEQASRDALTGLYNRRHGMNCLASGLAQAVRYGYPYAMVMLDIDHFKAVNDRHGHAVGDAVLYEMACVLTGSLRESDIPCRWGGEEFLVLLPHTDVDGAQKAAANWLDAIRVHGVNLDDGTKLGISFSAGIAGLPAGVRGSTDELAEKMLHEADCCMYAAKKAGRSRVVVPGQFPDMCGEMPLFSVAGKSVPAGG